MSGNSCAAKFLTGGEKSSLPLNHGLTVCWSVDTTSMTWLAISERIWLETISCASGCSDGGRVNVIVNSSARHAAAIPDITVVSQFQFQACRAGAAFAGEGNA